VKARMHVTLPPLGEYSPEAHFAPFVFVLEGMIKVNRHHIRQARDRFDAGLGPFVPPLVAAGVVVIPNDGTLADLGYCMQSGAGNIESLTIWRCAELQEAGERADPVIACDGRRVFCRVRRENGAIEDVCKMLTGRPDVGCIYDGNRLIKTLIVTLPPLGPFSPESHFAPLVFMLEGMILVNRHHIRLARDRAKLGLGRPAPTVFSSGVRYQEDPPGQENWGDLYYCLANGLIDCDRVTIWRCAEEQENGVPAVPVIKWQHLPRAQALKNYPAAMVPPDGLWMVHCLVRFPDGTIEDTSKALGMGGSFTNGV
jgi:hypothetical protein